MSLARNRHPWGYAEQVYLVTAKRQRLRHKVIARQLKRTPRSIDQQVSRIKASGILARHNNEELALLAKLLAEAQVQIAAA